MSSANIAPNTPVIVGIGEITDRTRDPLQSLEPIKLMAQALRNAEQDAGAALLADLDSLDIVAEYCWPYQDATALLAEHLGNNPARRHYGVAGGESPVNFMHEAALRIQRGESKVAAVVGAESNYAVNAAEKAKVELPWTPRDKEAKLLRGDAYLEQVAIKHGIFRPIQVYPLYENASQAAWGQSQREALKESGELWSRYSEVAKSNPYSWRGEAFSADEVVTPSDANRRICWPYTKRMVANPLVNMGAGILLTSVGHARSLGIPDEKMIFLLGGAAANEPRDYLHRDQYQMSHAQNAVLERILELVGGDVSTFAMLELYSCFPVVPKMARRTLGLPADAQMTSTGGLSFFGAPLNNYMTHATAGLVRALREQPGKLALCYGQGGYLTKHHAVILSSRPPQAHEALTPDYSVQAVADARRSPVPPLIYEYAGPATLETFTVVYGRSGEVDFGTVIARTPDGQRLMARVAPTDVDSIAYLTDLDATPIGSKGEVSAGDDGLLRWRVVL